MRRYLSALVLMLPSAGVLSATEPAPEKEVREAVARALPLIRKGSAGHMAQRTCFACHHQAVPVLAMTVARSRGFTVDDKEIGKHLRFIADFLGKNRAGYLKGRGQGGQVTTAGYALWTLELGGWKADATTAAVAEYLLQYNRNLDHWKAVTSRPPSEGSPFTSTAFAVRGLQTFGTAAQKKRIEERLEVIRGWLAKAPAKETEDRVFRLRALKRLADDEQVRAAAQELIEAQRPDGGWAQRDGMESDAYATGSVLVALHEAVGLAPDGEVYRKGVSYLLKTQRADGTWLVRSRSRPFQTYFESGFPHGKDQFISLSASSWATAALALSLPPAEPPAAEAKAGR
jgi:hypothetical protein